MGASVISEPDCGASRTSRASHECWFVCASVVSVRFTSVVYCFFRFIIFVLLFSRIPRWVLPSGRTVIVGLDQCGSSFPSSSSLPLPQYVPPTSPLRLLLHCLTGTPHTTWPIARWLCRAIKYTGNVETNTVIIIIIIIIIIIVVVVVVVVVHDTSKCFHCNELTTVRLLTLFTVV